MILMPGLSLLIIVLSFTAFVHSIQFGEPLNLIPKNRRILESKSTQQCLTVKVEDAYNLVLDNCNWDKGRTDTEGVFSIIKSNPGGHLLRWSTAPKYQGIEGCLTIRGEEDLLRQEDTVHNEEVYLAVCDPKSTVQNWMFQPANDKRLGEYIITKFGDGKCLSISSETDTPSIKTATCNKEDSDQIWRICEDIADLHKCDA